MTAGLSSLRAWTPLVCVAVYFGPVIEDSSRLQPVAQSTVIATMRGTRKTGEMRSGRLIPASCVDWGISTCAHGPERGNRPARDVRAGNDAERWEHNTGEVAEGVGFEPTVPCGTAVFKTARISHSRTPPPLWSVTRCAMPTCWTSGLSTPADVPVGLDAG